MTEDLRADARRNIRSILEAAARVLADDPAAGMQAIADAAGVSRPTVYRHFPRREDLIEAIRDEATAQALEKFDVAAASSEPADATLEHLIEGLTDIVARYPLLASLIGTDGHKREKRGPPDRVIKAFRALIARGRRDGTLRPDLRAETFLPITMGALVMALRAASERGSDPRAVGAEVAAIVLDGARPAG